MGQVMEIRLNKRDNQRKLGLDKGLRDAVGDYLARTYPTGTAKQSARRFDLTLDQARGAVAGKASVATIERIIKTGGWTVALAILADVIGTGIANYFIETRKAHDKDGERLAALSGHLWPVASPRGSDPPDVGDEEGDRRRSVAR